MEFTFFSIFLWIVFSMTKAESDKVSLQEADSAELRHFNGNKLYGQKHSKGRPNQLTMNSDVGPAPFLGPDGILTYVKPPAESDFPFRRPFKSKINKKNKNKPHNHRHEHNHYHHHHYYYYDKTTEAQPTTFSGSTTVKPEYSRENTNSKATDTGISSMPFQEETTTLASTAKTDTTTERQEKESIPTLSSATKVNPFDYDQYDYEYPTDYGLSDFGLIFTFNKID